MPTPRGLAQRFDQFLHRSGLLPRNARLLVAVSGGADSVGLLRLLVAVNGSDYWGWKLVVGHVEHGIRGGASKGDARFVRGLARELELPFVMRTLKLGARASEDAARDGRLRALAAMSRARRCAGVVMGHHADDHAETVLMKLFRGCGIDGLVGIAEESVVAGRGGRGGGVRLYRPLLSVRREEVRSYLKQIGQAWREDETNATDVYARNRLRRRVMPAVEEAWPGAAPAIARMSEIVRQTGRVVKDLAEMMWDANVRVVGKRRVEIAREKLRTWEAVAAEVLRRAVRTVGGSTEIADAERIGAAVRLIQGGEGGKRIEMGRGVTVEVGKVVVIGRKQAAIARGKKPKKKA